MQLIGFIQFITLVVNLLLGLLVLRKNTQTRSNQAFALFALGTSGWILSLYLVIYVGLDALFWGRLAFTFGSIMVAGLLWFTAEYPVRLPNARRYHVAAWVLGTVFSFLTISPFMIKSAEVREGSYIFGTFNPPVYLAWIVYFLGTILFSLVHAWRRVRKTSGVARRQYWSMAFGSTVFLVSMVVTQLMLPAVFNDFRWNGIGPAFSMVFLGFVAQSILYYRFFDIRWLLKWGVLFPILVTSVAGMFLYITLLTSRLLWGDSAYLVTAFLVAIIFRPFYQAVDRLSTMVARRGTYVFQDASYAITKIAERHLDLDRLLVELTEEIQRDFQFRKLGILVLDPGKGQIVGKRLQGYNGSLTLQAEQFMKELAPFGDTILEREELEWKLQYNVDPEEAPHQRALTERMRKTDVVYCIPFITERSIVGILVASEKASGEALSDTDIQLFKVIRNVMSPALSNAARFRLMQKLYEDLKESDRAKSEFIRVVSHQFRTPLTAIRWNAELLLSDGIKKTDLESTAAQVLDRSMFLADTLDRIFDILDLERGKVSYAAEPCDAGALVNASIKELTRVSKEHGVDLQGEAIEGAVMADPKKVQAILRTLLTNAIGFTPSGGSIRVQGEAKNGVMQLSVTDTGIGISPEEMPKVFQKFFRGVEASKMVPDGVGLGLFLAKTFAEGMGGKLSISSEQGKGTEAVLTLPMAEKKSSHRKQKTPSH